MNAPERQPKGGKFFLHPWEMVECYLLVHLSTGLKIFCEPKTPPPDNPDDRWDAYIIDAHADRLELANQAALDGTTVEKYVDYLAFAAMDMADKAIKARRKR